MEVCSHSVHKSWVAVDRAGHLCRRCAVAKEQVLSSRDVSTIRRGVTQEVRKSTPRTCGLIDDVIVVIHVFGSRVSALPREGSARLRRVGTWICPASVHRVVVHLIGSGFSRHPGLAPTLNVDTIPSTS